MKPIRAIIPAAGKGSRLQKISGNMPKAMFSVGNRPMIDYVLENISFIDNKNTCIVVGYGKEKIIDHLGDSFCYVEQKQQLGTGHAVMECAKEFENFNGSVLITFGDMPLFRRDEMEAMCLQHAESGADCTLMTAENPSLKSWARVIRNEKGAFQQIVEGKDCTPEQASIKELFSGVMVFNSESLFRILPEVSCSNVQKEYYITEVPELMVKKGMKVETYFTKDGDDLRGINTPEDLEICERILENRFAYYI
ncbi:MAG: sugar phosphate nucleotidyltransferase [Acutalibacteraceae bacterium]|nr:sugar phosphate nucleotidyltransferase [Acutalibacteraceae bacterium]